MLVLTRKTNQSISLGSNIRVTILDVEGDRVSVGIDAPKEVRIFRSELIDDTLRANRESLQSANFSRTVLQMKSNPPKGGG